jgi:hypothetical protein
VKNYLGGRDCNLTGVLSLYIAEVSKKTGKIFSQNIQRSSRDSKRVPYHMKKGVTVSQTLSEEIVCFQ